jgi:O-antigen/teichoic acid export membrane protein
MSIRRKVAMGAFWLILTRMGDRAVGFVSTLILARLLVPADFGVLALAMSVVALVDLIRQFGFEMVLISNQEADRGHFDTVWTLNLLFSLAVSVLIVLAAGPAAAFYEEPKLAPLMLLVALKPAFEGLQNVGVVMFQKELRFERVFQYIMTARVISFAIVIPLAFLLRSYWALAIGIVASQAARTLVSYVVHPYRPRISFRAARETLGFSSWLVANNAVQFVVLKSPDFVIGKILGVHALGLFNLSYGIGHLSASELARPISRAVFPAYAMQANDIGVLRRRMLEVVSTISLITLPVGVGLAAVSEFAVPVALGEKWRLAIPLVSMLAIYGTIKALGSNTAYIFLALKRPWLLLTLGVTESVILVPVLIFGVREYGLLGACWAYLIAVGVVAPIAYGLALALLKTSVGSLLAGVWRPFVSAGIMLLAVSEAKRLLPVSGEGAGLLDELIVSSAVGAVAYSLSVLGLWRLAGSPKGSESRVLAAVGEGFDRLRALTIERAEPVASADADDGEEVGR